MTGAGLGKERNRILQKRPCVTPGLGHKGHRSSAFSPFAAGQASCHVTGTLKRPWGEGRAVTAKAYVFLVVPKGSPAGRLWQHGSYSDRCSSGERPRRARSSAPLSAKMAIWREEAERRGGTLEAWSRVLDVATRKKGAGCCFLGSVRQGGHRVSLSVPGENSGAGPRLGHGLGWWKPGQCVFQSPRARGGGSVPRPRTSRRRPWRPHRGEGSGQPESSRASQALRAQFQAAGV